jgi:hypothetical protein
MTTDSSDTGPLVLLDKEAWRQLWRTVKKKAKELDAGITMLGEKIVAKCNQTPAITSALNTLFQRDQIPPTAGKWVGRAGVAVGGYGVYRGYQWLLNSSLNRKVAATESDLLPFLDLLKLQGLRQPDYRDVLHFCIDRRFFVTQFPASPPHKFKRAVPAIYDLIQVYGRDPAKQGVGVKAFLASDEVQSLFFEKEEDYKLIEAECYDVRSKQKLGRLPQNMGELLNILDNFEQILHIFDEHPSYERIDNYLAVLNYYINLPDFGVKDFMIRTPFPVQEIDLYNEDGSIIQNYLVSENINWFIKGGFTPDINKKESIKNKNISLWLEDTLKIEFGKDGQKTVDAVMWSDGKAALIEFHPSSSIEALKQAELKFKHVSEAIDSQYPWVQINSYILIADYEMFRNQKENKYSVRRNILHENGMPWYRNDKKKRFIFMNVLFLSPKRDYIIRLRNMDKSKKIEINDLNPIAEYERNLNR